MSHQPKPGAIAFASKVFDKSFDDKKKGNNNYRSSNSTDKGPNPNLKCTNCNKIFHIVDRCFDIVGYPLNYKKPNGQNNVKFMSNNNVVSSNNAASESRPSSFALPTLINEHIQRLMDLLSDKHVQNVHTNMDGWIVDSSKNQHISVSAKFIINIVDISNLGLIVGHPNVSLLSVHKLARGSELFVGFDEHKCYIQDLKEKNIVRTGKQSNGLYLFDIDNACKSDPSAFEDSEATDSVATSMEEETHPKGKGSLTHSQHDTSVCDTYSNLDIESTLVTAVMLVQNLRRSLRTHKVPAILNGFVVDIKSAINVLRYLKGSPSKGLKFTHNMLSYILEEYPDFDWAKCLKTIKSVSLDIVSFTMGISFRRKAKNMQLFPKHPLKLSTYP
nr:hypothetical protein [Tanacetum cinerariifolium]